MHKRKILSGTLVIAVLLQCTYFVGCKREEETVTPPPPEQELVTTVILIAKNKNNNTDSLYSVWRDLTPGDINPPTRIDTIKFTAGEVYTGELLFLDETKNPIGDITSDIRNKANYHIVCYLWNGLSNVFDILKKDYDTNNPPLPLGLITDIKSGSAATGSLTVQLRHQPNVKDGTCAPGEIDVNISFPIEVK